MFGKLLVVIFILVTSTGWVFASPPTILSNPESIKVDEEFILTASMSGLTKNGVYRLRVALSKPEIHVYFGSIEDQGTFSKYKNITMDDKGSWSGDVRGKVENSDPNYKDKDLKVFELKLGRYTENGTSATWSESKLINLENSNSPTIIPNPTQKPQPTSTKSPVPTIIPQKTPVPTETINEEDIDFESENILATSTSIIIVSPKPSDPLIKKSMSKVKYLFIIGAFFFFIASGLAFIKRKKDN